MSQQKLKDILKEEITELMDILRDYHSITDMRLRLDANKYYTLLKQLDERLLQLGVIQTKSATV